MHSHTVEPVQGFDPNDLINSFGLLLGILQSRNLCYVECTYGVSAFKDARKITKIPWFSH